MFKQNYANFLSLSLASVAVFTLSTPKAEAAILWDYSPETTGTTSGTPGFVSLSTGQNFAEIVSFADAVELTGMDIYSTEEIEHQS